jgi:UDP-glucose 4-epimerase
MKKPRIAMKKALITGGMGFIGNFLANRLLSLGIEVLILDKSIYKPTFHNIQAAQRIEGDVLSHQLLQECLSQVDTCFHLAALSSVPACTRDWIFSHENNVLAFNGLLEELRRVPHPVKLIYASSAAVYGESQHLPLSESEHVTPCSTYGADKLSNEIYAEVARRAYGIKSIGLRLFNVYGPGQLESNSYSGVITSFRKAINADEPLIIYGDGKQTRDFIYIEDVVDGLHAAALAPPDLYGIFNICGGKSISILELAKLMLTLANKKNTLSHQEPRKGDTYHSLGNPKLAEKKLNFKAKISMQKGLDFFLKQDTF